MKTLFLAAVGLLLTSFCFAQHVYSIRADTVRIYNTCDTAELVLENRTKDTLGFLYNKGQGRTEFRRLHFAQVGATKVAIIGQDTLDLAFLKNGDTAYVPKNRTLTLTGGSGISVSPNTVQDLSANRLWTISNTGVTKVNGLTGDVTVAPDAGSPNYIQNQLSAVQTGNFWLNGEGRVSSLTTPLVLSNNSGSQLNLVGGATGPTSARGGEIDLLAGGFATTPGEIVFRTGTALGGAAQPERMRIDATGNVGIGNTDPTFKLDVAGTTRITGNTTFAANGTPAAGKFPKGSDAAGNWTWQTLTAGDIPTGSTGYIQNQSAAAQATSNFYLSGTGRTNNAFQVTKDGSGSISSYFVLNNAAATRGASLQLDANANPGLNFWIHNGTAWQNMLTITATGGVGINTSTPATGVKLHVNGTTQLGGATAITGNTSITGNESIIGNLAISSSNPLIALGNGVDDTSFIQMVPGGRLDFNNRNAYTSFTGNANVGMGITTSDKKLHVLANAVTTIAAQNSSALSATSGGFLWLTNSGLPTAANQRLGGLVFTSNPTGNTNRAGVQVEGLSEAAWTDGTSHPAYLRFMTTPSGNANPAEQVRITAAGNVGIGVTSPIATLDVNGVINTNNSLQAPRALSNVSAGRFDIIGGAIAAGSLRGGQIGCFGGSNGTSPGIIAFYTGTGSGGAEQPERMRITATGSVGIGTTTPGNTLHVVGTARIAGVADVFNASFIRGTSSGQANISHLAFMEMNGTTRKGYVGDGSGSDKDIYLQADSGNVKLVPMNSTVNLNVQVASMDYNGGQLLLNRSGANLLSFNAVSLGAPTLNTRSAGSKITLWNAAPTATNTGWDIGMETSHMWFSIAQSNSTNGFKWYADTTQIARMDGLGNLTMRGQVQATSFFQSSLRSLKKDIQPFDQSALAVFEKVQVRTFKFKADPDGKTNIGFIADEVPDEMATPKRNGVDQASTVALLVKAVQELTEQNKALQQEVNAIKQQLKDKGIQQ